MGRICDSIYSSGIRIGFIDHYRACWNYGCSYCAVARVAFRQIVARKVGGKICDQCSENDLLSKLQDANDDYWNNTRIAFETGSMNVEKEWKVQLSEMEKDIESPETNKSSIEKHIDFLHKMKGHWEGLPWGQDGQG